MPISPAIFGHMMFFGGLLLVSGLFALVEIQVEGPTGWGAQLPTWKIENRWTKLLWSSRPLTGYNFWLMAFVAAFVHCPYFMGFARPTWAGECRILAFLGLFWVVEDFLWFVINPAFGLKKFRKEHIWWHEPTWWWIMPRDYWIFTPISVGLYVLSLRLSM